MESGTEFVDHYDILQVNPNCDAKVLETAYRHLAKMFHPDNVDTADVTRFNDVIAAYRVLRDPAQRAKYDTAHAIHRPRVYASAHSDALGIDEKTALSDAEIHAKILLYLYKRRREHASDAGVVGYILQEMLKCSDEHFAFHSWYLKSKGLLEITEQGTLAITIEGVDHVIATSRTVAAEKLLIAKADDQAEPAG
ncbi:DnaJ domain-containing protein [Altererythrobacter aerius]|uniref:DnaJ domain-containing protein n=1 Tax=Tsuneonella aeria TaxID=1837929 RepID=A0A6I4TBW7_9SPHN|nr:J domain-containing protein [Tsuneonella aeria]MXO74543.1 DnaJ domain-containing protein [Tsuneonella aeria]